jgi:hypothetical protein
VNTSKEEKHNIQKQNTKQGNLYNSNNNDLVKGDEMGRACKIYGGEEECT